MILPDSIHAELQIDLNRIVANWRRLAEAAAPAQCAAVVKADAYGLGDAPVVRALVAAGCRAFFVATLDEAVAIQPHVADDAQIFIFNGLGRGEVDVCREQGFVPVLSTPDQIGQWQQCNQREQRALPCMLQVDTGMNRLGLESAEWHDVVGRCDAAVLNPAWIMSHLACAEQSDNPLNANQLQRFRQVVKECRAWAPGAQASFANSSGVWLGRDYHFEQVRPGIAIYGGNPELGRPNRFDAVARLRLPVLQLREVGQDGSVGYGATATVKAGARLATVHSGYADGLLVTQSKQGWGEVAGHRVPMIGRISMDLTIFDVSDVPASVWSSDEPAYVDVLNDSLTIDDMAEAAGTISYEILTALGQRYRRSYIGEIK